MKLDLSVCIIDDDELYTFLLSKILERNHLYKNITNFLNGEEAITAFKSWEASKSPFPDIVLLDINMPIMDGWDFIEAYKQLSPEAKKNTKVFIMSSSIAQTDIDKSKSYKEISAYLFKPVSEETLVNIFNK
jgi:CheY-like chemotaxis protein